MCKIFLCDFFIHLFEKVNTLKHKNYTMTFFSSRDVCYSSIYRKKS